MREVVNLNTKWAFSKEATAVPEKMPENWYWVNLPHTWNAIDGQDGGNDYYRGTCYYAKTIEKVDLPLAERYVVEINGANSSATLYWNGQKIAAHNGGYSTWRADVTDAVADTNLVVIAVDNAPNDHVYPQSADFTFYGGLYRDVNLICVPEHHFELERFGTPGISVQPAIEDGDATVEVKVEVHDQADASIRYTLRDADGSVVDEATSYDSSVTMHLSNVHLWQGRKDPYLYSAEATLVAADGTELDRVSTRFGCRTVAIDPDRGFLLNGKEYPLHGVARHQDRWQKGNALSKEDHEEDVDLICELGATAVRLAHYQHDQYFYDLCDERGLIVWAEIPYITIHMPNGHDNVVQQLRELITQSRNHASIAFWSLSNEIDAAGEHSDEVLATHRELNEIAHKMDPSRLTVEAAVTVCSTDQAYLSVPDALCYNHYFGWYGGDNDQYGPWFDKFHAEHPDIPIGISEYGCEALNWHTSEPDAGDYTEEYQAQYHESLIKQLYTRPYLWATFCWNMFDFGADARNEGGEPGQNHKGLVTFDRKYKKDSFYAYKAWLNPEPMVHVCGKRYVDRPEDTTKVTVYSNQPSVKLYANDELVAELEAPDHFFHFEVPLSEGKTKIVAVAGECKDSSLIRKVDAPNPAYRLVERGAILNWWDITEVDGYCSLNTKIRDIVASAGIHKTCELLKPVLGEAAQAKMMDTLGSMTVIRVSGLLSGMLDVPVAKEDLLSVNAELNKVRLPES